MLLALLRKALDRYHRSYRFREAVSATSHRGLGHHAPFAPGASHPGSSRGVLLEPIPAPYRIGRRDPDGTATDLAQMSREAAAPILITARFRSGSTFLWSIFDRAPGFTAYYEPLNERMWFDPSIRGSKVDPTHRGVTSYYRTYEGLEELGACFNKAWGSSRLYMDERDSDCRLERYIRILTQKAPHRPVLQFNRIDFRLAWIRSRFPEAFIVHLFRNPRDQWASMLRASGAVPRDLTIEQFRPFDGFYLHVWWRDLRRVFPLLDDEWSPYAVHYLIWRLSYCFGRAHADLSIAYEDLVDRWEGALSEIGAVCGFPVESLAPVDGVRQPRSQDRWKTFAHEEWFHEQEEACERALRAYFAAASEPRRG